MEPALDRALARCLVARGQDRDVVQLATQLVRERFRTYSLLHVGESVRTAFERRRGYCAQYNGALAELLRGCGLDASLVQARRVVMLDRPGWAFGHIWVRVRPSQGQVLDVCAGTSDFVPLTEVRPVGRLGGLTATAGSGLVARVAQTRAVLAGRPLPDWVEHAMPPVVSSTPRGPVIGPR